LIKIITNIRINLFFFKRKQRVFNLKKIISYFTLKSKWIPLSVNDLANVAECLKCTISKTKNFFKLYSFYYLYHLLFHEP
jgi:hypothetical protein